MAERSAPELAAMLGALADTLLPGDDRFPSASAAGIHGVVAERLRAQAGGSVLDRLADALGDVPGGFAALDEAARVAAVKRAETNEPALFDTLLLAAYTAYYESPAVVRALRGLGHTYNDAPQPDGYVMPAFDSADPAQAPTHRRGAYVATEAVSRVDLASIADEPLAPEHIERAAGVGTGRGPLSRGTRGGDA